MTNSQVFSQADDQKSLKSKKTEKKLQGALNYHSNKLSSKDTSSFKGKMSPQTYHPQNKNYIKKPLGTPMIIPYTTNINPKTQLKVHHQ